MAQEQQREEFLIRDRVTGQPRPYYVAADNINLGDDENYQSLPDTLKEMQDDIDAASGGGGGEGTVTAVKMNNGTPIEPNNDGVVDLGTVITSHQSLAALFGRVAYDGTTHRINFYGKDDVSMTTVLGYIDCSPFIVDGMLSNVEVKNVTINNVSTPCMVFSFNTDAGKQNINIPVSSIFNAANYYTKDDADGRFQLKLVSGTNIKTVNNTSILGEGNINVSAGADGVTPHIGANGNWWVGPETDSNNDTGIKAQGPKGDKGDTVVIGDEEEFTIVNDLTTGGESDALSAEMGKRLALTTGTYEQAWQRSKVITGLFSFIWDEMGFKKPIWHIGNSVFVDAAGGIVSAAQAANVPADPTFTSNGSSISDNSSVAKNTQVTITPATNSVLYYRIGSSGDYTASLSAVTLTLATAGSVVLSAYCVNTKGNSNTSTLNLTVEGTQVPTFAAKSGTTIDNNDVVSRGGYVVITGAVGGTLKYKVGSASSYTEVAGVGDTAPSAEVQITGATTIKAYNVVDGDDSAEITKNYTMAALAAPTFSKASGSELAAGGETITLSGPTGATIYYNMTTDGTEPATPTDASTAYSSGISVTQASKIKAIAKDSYGYSEAVLASYTVAVDHKFQFKIRLTDSNLTEYIPVKSSLDKYTMTVDWGDGTEPESIDRNYNAGWKLCSHTYQKKAGSNDAAEIGDEYTITLRGTAIPYLLFGLSNTCNRTALLEIISNTLSCETRFANNGLESAFDNCSNLTSVSGDAISNEPNKGGESAVSFSSIFKSCTNLASIGDGFFSGFKISSAANMFRTCTSLGAIPSSLKAALATATNLSYMFYDAVATSSALPTDMFDSITAETVTTVSNLFNGFNWNKGYNSLNDASVFWAVLYYKVTSSATLTSCFTHAGMDNTSNVPSTWGGSGASDLTPTT